ncbi:S41 family peptidase [Desulfobacterota bacterium AH_259_B03_O07]|nr:S41 family peptidase [Desulfobacterota bacterium AH_259_B03_O07]
MKNIHFTFVIIALLLFFSLFSSVSENKEKDSESYDLGVLPLVIRYVKKYYVNKPAINPKTMLINGMGRLEKSIDEVLVDFPDGENSTSFRVQVLNESETFDMNGIYDLKSMKEKIEEVFRFIRPRLTSEEPEIRDVEYAVIDEMLKTLDPHSGIITPQVYQEFMIETEGSFGGLGIVIGIRDGRLTVISPIEGTPAYRAGIKSNDRIVQIENESTINMSLIEAVGKLRGRKGSAVNIFVDREGYNEPKKFNIVRDTIKIESVETFDIDDGILYVRIRDFQKNTLNSIKEGLEKRKDSIRGLILDLRGNPGGLLDQAEKISDVFLKRGVIVSTKIGESKKLYSARQRDSDFTGKVVVLIDSGSASASEIVAGALKNNDRAVIVGKRTFGKGSVQQIFDLNDGSALKLTIANYLTPGDISIQDVGITPDILLQPAVILKDAVIFNSSEESRQKDSNEKQERKVLEDPIYSIRFLDTSTTINNEEEEITPEEALTREEKRQKINNDFYIDVAKEIINSTNSLSRELMLHQSESSIKNLSKNEEVKMGEKWQEMGIDWSSLETASRGAGIKVNVSPANLNFKAGEKLPVTVEVENNGSTPLYRLSAVTKSDNPIFDGKEYIFGKLNPGEKRKWDHTFDIPKWALTREDKITLQFMESNNTEVPEHTFKARIEELPRPRFTFNYEIVDDGRYDSIGNGNGIPELGETIGLLLRVKNNGKGKAQKSIVTLNNLSGDKIFLEKGRFEFENLSPGQIKESAFNFVVKQPDSQIEMELQIVEDVFRDGIISKINILEEEKEDNFLNSSQSIVVLNDKALIKGGSFRDAPVLAVSEKGTGFNTVGENDEWVKIKLNENLIGWIKKDDIIFVDFVSSPTDTSSLIEVFEGPPVIDVKHPPLSTNSSEVVLNGLVKDIDGVDLVYVFLDDNKVMLIPAKDNEVPISINLKLNDGTNVITIFAKDSNGLISKESIVIRKEV